tara:strand:- start:272 stop:724 length:453 start_codon:yes stop_codon:yes gene_type:complete
MTELRQKGATAEPRNVNGEGQLLALCEEGGVTFAGKHLLIELWGAKALDSEPSIRRVLSDAVEACHATLLDISLHQFSPTGGISGVAILGESHMSIHTWPEHDYAAIDVFMCGSLDPQKSVPVLKEGFQPKRIQVMEIKRGVMDGEAVVP